MLLPAVFGQSQVFIGKGRMKRIPSTHNFKFLRYFFLMQPYCRESYIFLSKCPVCLTLFNSAILLHKWKCKIPCLPEILRKSLRKILHRFLHRFLHRILQICPWCTSTPFRGRNTWNINTCWNGGQELPVMLIT